MGEIKTLAPGLHNRIPMKKNPIPLESHYRLNMLEFNCPVALLRIRKTLKQMDQGQILEVVGLTEGLKTDLTSIISRSSQERILNKDQVGDFFIMHIEKTRRTL